MNIATTIKRLIGLGNQRPLTNPDGMMHVRPPITELTDEDRAFIQAQRDKGYDVTVEATFDYYTGTTQPYSLVTYGFSVDEVIYRGLHAIQAYEDMIDRRNKHNGDSIDAIKSKRIAMDIHE